MRTVGITFDKAKAEKPAETNKPVEDKPKEEKPAQTKAGKK